MIPKIIHQTYKDHSLPGNYKRCQNEIRKLHPDFEYRFYTDEDMYKLMQKEFPEYYTKFNELPRMIMKIDMFRYFLMYKYGGLYADLDYLMIKPFDLLDYKVVIPSNREKDEIPTCLGNCIFASEPSHPFWKSLIDTLFTVDRSLIDYKIDSNIDGHILGTGPVFVFDMWQKGQYTDIHIPRRLLFHPATKMNDTYINGLKAKGCYGMHMCAALWRDNKL